MKPLSCARSPWMMLSLTLLTSAASAQQANGHDGKPPTGGEPAPSLDNPSASQSNVRPLSDSLSGEAKREYESARLLFEDGDYSGALLKIEQAHRLSGDARLLWNMAVCYKQMRRYAQVLAYAERYLAEGGDLVTADDRREATALVDVVRDFVGPLSVACSEPGAEVWVDGEKVATTPMEKPYVVDMGAHRIEVRKEGFRRVKRKVHVEGSGRSVQIEVTLQPLKHEGQLTIVARQGDEIWLDGNLVGRGRWDGKVPSGEHSVKVSAPGMKDHFTELVVRDDERRDLRVQLEPTATTNPLTMPAPEPPRDEARYSSSTWWYVTGAALLIAGVAVGGYFLFSPKDEPAPDPIPGTIDPGTVHMPLRF